MWEQLLEQAYNDVMTSFGAVPAAVVGTRLLAALVLGGAVGMEREARGKPAGLRTHMLVSMAACLFVLVSEELVELPVDGETEKRVDPLRLVEAVTAGVAFLAAGTIISNQGKVRNLTTGASMWLAGAIGLACGSGHVALAGLAAIIVVVILTVVRQVEILMGTD
ncbi:MgtC/SapB transporter [Marinibacterium profundimaris]|uniref:Protein MgtC n=2 Tax=Marinibacterium profundimaris TaxID=1679460 RepID=A0A225NGK6_9RHOB|nr:MgtC/SapB transporter [Marinibacterium profundimaris]